MYNPFSLENKTILVTGASSGIGRAIAIECSKMGASVIITGRNEERLKETHAQMEGNQPDYIVADLSLPNDVQNLVQKITSLNGLVNCAGLTKSLPFQFATRKNIDEVFNINFFAPVEISRLLVKNKKIKGGSSIVFISSISGVYYTIIGNSIYSASKGAINGIVKSMALELAPKSIRVNCINPGMINTNLLSEGIISKDQLQEDMKKYPLKRYGKPEEVAFAAIYLLSDASNWVTGSNLLIDGGLTLT